MKILITGTAGFIGFHLAKKLVERGDVVIGFDNINNYYDINLKYSRLFNTGIKEDTIVYNKIVKSTKYPNYRFIKLNLEDRENIIKLFEEEDIENICHLAAQAGVRYSMENPHLYLDSNILGFLNILESSRQKKINHLIYASSSSVYGSNNDIPFSTNDSVDHPISVYAATKKSVEMFAHVYSYVHNIPTTGMRFFTVYGPWGRPDMALYLFIKNILEEKPINIYNYGNMQRAFTYIDDIIEGIVRIIDKPSSLYPLMEPKNKKSSSNLPYKIYNIGNSNSVRLIDFVEAIEEVLGKKAEKKFLPLQIGDIPITCADMLEFEKDFGYKPNTSLKKGIKMTVEWYLQFYKKN